MHRVVKAAGVYLNLARKLPRWARHPLEPDPWLAVRSMLAARDENFLALMRSAVFGNASNPYHRLFAWAGCEFGDLERMVRADGLESALRSLLAAGVYLEHDEFKGGKPVRRGGREMLVDPALFANADPRFPKAAMESSSGSRSRGTVVWRSLEYQTYREAQERVLFSDFESGRELVSIDNILPAMGGVRRSLHYGLRGGALKKWFSIGSDPPYPSITRVLLLELRALGIPTSLPEILPHNDFSPVARYLAARKRAGAHQAVNGTASKLVRIAAAATDLGLDISGVLFHSSGEALTAAKRAVIERAGVEVHARYVIAELGTVGAGCRQMRGNCVHVSKDALAVIDRRRVAPLSETEVDSLLFTTLLPHAATVLVNVEMDDAGALGPATCDCRLKQMGFDQQIDDIFSYGKLTGYGTCLVGNEILELLEERLPARFGGVPGDYQLVEREGAHQTELELRISPRLGLASADEVRTFFLDQIRLLWGGGLARNFWTRSESVRAVVADPYVAGRGKVHALHLLGSSKAREKAPVA